MGNVTKIQLPDGNEYTIKDTGALPLTGGTVTGPVSFGNSVSIDEATIGDLVVNGNGSFTNNINANTINSVTVGSSPKFTDTVTTATTTGSGNAVTAITASDGVLTVTKGETFLTSFTETDPTVPSWAKASTKPSYTASEVGAAASSHAHGNIGSDGKILSNGNIGDGDALVIIDSSDSNKVAGTRGYLQFDGSTTSKYLSQKGSWETLPQGTAYSAGTGLDLSGTTFNHSNSVTAQTTQAVYPIKIDAQGHISAYGSAVTIPDISGKVDKTCTYTNVSGYSGVQTIYNDTYEDSGYTYDRIQLENVGQYVDNNVTHDIENSVTIDHSGVGIGASDGAGSYYANSWVVVEPDDVGLGIIGSNYASMSIGLAYSNGTPYAYINANTLELGRNTYRYTVDCSSPTANRTLTLPDKTGTIALTSDIPTVPTKVSDLTNDSGYVTTDEKVSTAAVNSGTTYYLTVGTNTTSAETKYYDSKGLKYTSTQGNSNRSGSAVLTLGQSANAGSANGRYGTLEIYSELGKKASIYPQATLNSDRTYALPNKSGTVALTSDIPTVPTSAGSATTGVTIADHSSTTIYGVQSSTTSVTGVQSSTTTASKVTLGTAISVPNVTAAGSGSFTQGSFSGGSFTQGEDSFTPNTPTVIDTTKFSGGSYSHSGFSGGSFTRGSFSGGSGSFTQGAFSGGSLTMTMDTTDTKKLNITFTAATHGADSHTHTAATHGADSFTAATYGTDSFTAAKLNTGFYTAGTAASFTQGEDSFTPATHGADSHTHTPPTLGTAKSIPNVTGVSDVTVPIKNTSATTVPIKNSSTTTVITSKTHTVTDNGHTHSLS